MSIREFLWDHYSAALACKNRLVERSIGLDADSPQSRALVAAHREATERMKSLSAAIERLDERDAARQNRAV